jgi:hypothetical protein
MKNLTKINKREKFFLVTNAFIAGTGTAAGFAFPSLSFLAALLKFTGAALVSLSIVGIVAFSILAALVGLYFFIKTFSNTQNLIEKAKNTQKAFQKTLVESIILKEKAKTSLEDMSLPPLSVKESPEFTPLLKFINQKFLEFINKQGCNNQSLNLTLINAFKSDMENTFNSDENLKNIYQCYERSIFQLSQDKLAAYDSPKLLGGVNSFVGYGSILGPCSGLIGAITGIGVIGGISTIAWPILLSLILTTLLLSCLTAYAVYYLDNHSTKRQRLLMVIEKETKNLTDANQNLFLSFNNPHTIDSNQISPTIFSAPAEEPKDTKMEEQQKSFSLT